jgi:hypothetical protein
MEQTFDSKEKDVFGPVLTLATRMNELMAESRRLEKKRSIASGQRNCRPKWFD